MKGCEKIKFYKKRQNLTKEWLPFDKILENGIIVTSKAFIKIIKIKPINYDLKSNLEKEAVLNSYKLFLKSCDFDIQILIQSKKEDLSKYFFYLNKISENEKNEKIKDMIINYISFIKKKAEENKSSTKNFFIIIKYNFDEKEKQIKDETEELAKNFLKDCFFKIKESLSRCGNLIYDINSKEECEEILSNFFVPNKKQSIEMEE